MVLAALTALASVTRHELWQRAVQNILSRPCSLSASSQEEKRSAEKLLADPAYVGNWAAVTAGEPAVNTSGASARAGGWGHLLAQAGHDVNVSRGKGEPWEGLFMIAQAALVCYREVERSVESGGWSMKRVIKVLVVALLMVAILMTSVSPAMALRRPGGVLLEPTDAPSNAPENAQGVDIELNPEGRLPGCWVLLPPNAP